MVFLITVSLMLMPNIFTTSSKFTSFLSGIGIRKSTLSILQYVFMPLAPEKAVAIIRTWFCSIKKRGSRTVTRPTNRGSGIARYG